MTSDEFRLGLIQMRCVESAEANMESAIQKIKASAKSGAQVICLPELFLSPYFCKVHDLKLFDLAETIPGPRTDQLGRLAKELGVVIVASLFEKRINDVYHNTAVILDADGSIAGIYRKMHIPHDPLFFEKYYFRPGDLGFQVIKTRFAKIGTLICWDQWFPEGARLTAMKGAEVLVYPTAIGWHPREKAEFGVAQHDAWETIQRGHAIANGVYVGAINRIGFEPSADGGLEFWGGSFISDPFGIILQKGSVDQEENLLVACSRSRMQEVRRNWPFFRDRRTDAYGNITQTVLD